MATNFWGRVVMRRPIRLLECDFSPGGPKSPLPSSPPSYQELLSFWSQQPGGRWYPWPAESSVLPRVAGDAQHPTPPPSLPSSRHHSGSWPLLPARPWALRAFASLAPSGAVRLASVVSLPVFFGGKAVVFPCSFPTLFCSLVRHCSRAPTAFATLLSIPFSLP